MISFKFVFDPQHAAAASGLTLGPGVGITNVRAAFGGFRLSFAVILLFCLFSSHRLQAALASIATVAVVILLVRLYGAAQDDTFGQSAHLLLPEMALAVVSLVGLVIETRRRARSPA